LGQFVKQIRTENAKILAMIAPLGITEHADQPHDRSASPVSMVAVVQRLRNAERRKQRCLRAIASAPAEVLSETARRFQAFAAESLVVAARNIIELEKFG